MDDGVPNRWEDPRHDLDVGAVIRGAADTLLSAKREVAFTAYMGPHNEEGGIVIVDKRRFEIRFENETESQVTIRIDPKQ